LRIQIPAVLRLCGDSKKSKTNNGSNKILHGKNSEANQSEAMVQKKTFSTIIFLILIIRKNLAFIK
ncbi:MAG: hypothetical protein P1V20_19885, partial [Verrucomicrobiales bacterium]|nr:hypothetical protein [Verrucomicrobiales bacterium]